MSDRSVFTHRLGVRFRDCDMFGHVNNAVYFTYFEEARVAWWRNLGAADLPSGGTVVVHAECDYRVPVLLNHPLEVEVFLVGIGRTSYTLGYRLVRTDIGALMAEGKTVSVTTDPVTGQPIPVPETLRALMLGQA